jgi:hypothetical protein
MFRVLVLGGFTLIGGNACGGSPTVFTSADASPRDVGSPANPFVQPDASDRADADGETGTFAETDASVRRDAAADAGGDVDAAASASCPPYEVMMGNACFPMEAQ